jgi:hypothetical protein
MKYNIPVQKSEDGHLYLEFPDKLMEKMRWKIGDTIDWHYNKDGTFSLIKVAKPSKSKRNKV